MKIIVYDDNPEYGGHQAMACRGIEALCEDPSNQITCLINPENRKLARRLANIESCQTRSAPCTTRRCQGLLNRITDRGIKKLQLLFQSLEADLILCIQGDIEQSSQAVIAARRAPIECVSYIALPHCMTTMGAKFGALRDAFNQYLFNQPSRYIAISESMAAILRTRGARQRIDIVPNGIAMPHTPCPTRQERPGSRFTLGLLGRVEFNQKQQDFMVRTFCIYPEAFENCNLLIMGDGPDSNQLEKLIAQCSRRSDIELKPWTEDTACFFSSIDILVIPSRYEGVPLVMLEALVRGIPVLASRCDGMKDVLPEDWTFDPENAGQMVETFCKARLHWNERISSLQKRMRSDYNINSFKTNFLKAVKGL